MKQYKHNLHKKIYKIEKVVQVQLSVDNGTQRWIKQSVKSDQLSFNSIFKIKL